jgi:hypothetical protein
MSESKQKYRMRSRRGIRDFSAGWAGWRWLAGSDAKQNQWFLGILRGRSGYLAWLVILARAFQDPNFLVKFESEVDPWARSKMVGQKISEIRRKFEEMTDEQRSELAREGEVELKAGLELMGRDKKTVQDLIAMVDPPTIQS